MPKLPELCRAPREELPRTGYSGRVPLAYRNARQPAGLQGDDVSQRLSGPGGEVADAQLS